MIAHMSLIYFGEFQFEIALWECCEHALLLLITSAKNLTVIPLVYARREMSFSSFLLGHTHSLGLLTNT